MVKPRKKFETSAPWRGHLKKEEEDMLCRKEEPYVPRNHNEGNDSEDVSVTQIDSKLRYAFRRNYRFLQNVFSIDTMVKPLPPAMAENVSRNLSFFGRIFTQFSDPEGISNAQKSLGLGREEKLREVR